MSVERKIEIDSASYASSFLQKYDKLRQDGRHCDFTIKVGDDVHQVHRTVLIISSEYFRAMLEHDTEEKNQGFVNMRDVDPSAVRKAIEFIYTGKASVADDDIAGLIHVAYLMQLDVLCEGIGKLLADGISAESFCATKKFADMYKCKGLGNTCKEFACNNFKDIIELDDFVGLEEDYILTLINSPSTKATEVQKYKAFKNWIDSDELGRRESFSKMLGAIKVEDLPASFRGYIIENEPMVYKSAECMLILTKSLLGTFKVSPRDFDTHGQNAIAGFSSGTASLLAYKTTDESWHEIGKLDNAVTNYSFCIVNVDDIMFALRGDRKVFRLEYLNTATVTWTEMSPMLHSHGNWPPVVVHNKRIYAIGNSDNPNITAEAMDPAKNTWTQVNFSRQCSARKDYSLCASENSILLIGGISANNYYNGTNECDRLDVSGSSWQPVRAMTKARVLPCTACKNGKMYVVGGSNLNPQYYGPQNCETVVEVYDISANTWTSIANFPAVSERLSAAFVMDTLYVFGTSRILEYDTVTNTWKQKNNKGQQISTPSGCVAITY